MKRTLLTILSVLFCAISFAQSVPQGINYQAVARDASGDVLMNQALTIQFSVISDITTSAVSWQETHTVNTNDYGLYTAIIGGGTTTSVGSSATFDVIDWGASNHLLKVEVDFGSGYLDMGTTAFMSVPYSIYSANPGPQGLPGLPGVDGAVGAQGPIGPNMIPYEPWNMNIPDQTSPISALQTFFIHFIAPFSGVYTSAKMLTSPTSVTGSTVNYLGMAIYSNTPYTTVISGTPANGRPNAPVTQGSIQGLSLTSPNLFLEVPLAPAFSLVEGESYWFAFAWDRGGPPVSANIFADYSAYNTAANCILKANGLYTGNISPSFATVVAGNLQQADESVWFRLK